MPIIFLDAYNVAAMLSVRIGPTPTAHNLVVMDEFTDLDEAIISAMAGRVEPRVLCKPRVANRPLPSAPKIIGSMRMLRAQPGAVRAAPRRSHHAAFPVSRFSARR